ncbi:MAG: transposase [Rhodospirillaceae bacterium]
MVQIPYTYKMHLGASAMAMGQLSGRTVPERPSSMLAVALAPRHWFYDNCNQVLREAEFDHFVEMLCREYYADEVGRPSVPPGRYFRMLFVGQYEGLDSERDICWWCSDSLSLHRFLMLQEGERVPDHSTLSVTRSRLPVEVHEAVFTFILEIADKHGLVQGQRVGIDASTMEANAALRKLVRRDTGETYDDMLRRLAEASGIETPTKEELIRFDRKRKGKTLSNEDWASPTDGDARIAKMKNGSTRLAYKPEHGVDLDTGIVTSAVIHLADQGDTTTLAGTLDAAAAALGAVAKAPTPETPAEAVADKGYHARGVLKDLDDGPWKARISEPDRPGLQRWRGDDDARRAVYNNRARLKSQCGKEALRLRAEKVERTFEHLLDQGGMRRTWLRGRDNVQKRYSCHVAAYNLGMVLRLRFGAGTPRQAMAAFLFVIAESQAVGSAIQPSLVIVMITIEAERGNFVVPSLS